MRRPRSGVRAAERPHPPAARTPRVALAWVLAVTLVPLAYPLAAAAPAEAASGPSSTCINTPAATSADPPMRAYSNEQSPLLLPPWGDAGGWSQPSQYETILSGDLEGDGYGDLVARNASAVEAHTVAPPLRPPDPTAPDPSTNAPFPGQWVPKRGDNAPSTPERGQHVTMAGQAAAPQKNEPANTEFVELVDAQLAVVVPQFSMPSRYETFRLADLDGQPGDELLVRRPLFSAGPGPTPLYWPTGSSAPPVPPSYLGSFLVMYRYDGTTGTWSDGVVGPQVSDSDASPARYGYGKDTWDDPQYYDTLVTGDVDGNGRDDVVLRGPDLGSTSSPSMTPGLTTWRLNDAGTGFEQLGPPADLMNAGEGFSQPQNYTTLRLADFDGDGRDDLVAQFAGGLNLYTWNGAGWAYNTDAPGGDNATLAAWSQANPWTAQPAFYTTIGTAVLEDTTDPGGTGPTGQEPRAAVFALEPTGLRAYHWVDGPTGSSSGSWQALTVGASVLTGPQWTSSMADPKDDPNTVPYYSTIQAADVIGTPAAEVIARDTDGIHVYSYDPTTQAFGDLGISPTFGDGVALSDANGWNQPQRYQSIATAFVATGQPRALIARDTTGLRTYVLPDAQAVEWVPPTASFPAWANGADADDYVPDGTALNYPAARAYNYLNTQVGNQLWPVPSYPGQPAQRPATIRSRFTDLGQDMGTVGSALGAVRPQGVNVPRQTWNAVKQQMTDWSYSVQRLRAYFFSSTGNSGLEQLLLTGLVAGDTAYSAEQIQQQFDAKDTTRMWALIGDLLWGVIGGLPDGDSSALGFAFSMMGAGTAAGLTYAPSNKYQAALTAEADDIDEVIANTFCETIAFLYGSHDQAVADLGLLTAMDIAISANPVSSQQAQLAQSEAVQGRAVWTYQQFAGMSSTDDGGWQMVFQPAYCLLDTPGASLGNCSTVATPVAVNPDFAKGPVIGVYYVMPVNRKCNSDSDGLQKSVFETLTKDLGVDPLDMATPGWTFWVEPPPKDELTAHQPGDPKGWAFQDTSGNSTTVIGVLGWHTPFDVMEEPVPSGSCSGTRGAYVPRPSS